MVTIKLTDVEKRYKEAGYSACGFAKAMRMNPATLKKKLSGDSPIKACELIRLRDLLYPGKALDEFADEIEKGLYPAHCFITQPTILAPSSTAPIEPDC